MGPPPTQYAKSGDTSIAYQVVGEGPIDLVLVLGFATHIELQWEGAPFARFCERLGSFTRLIIFDKRGTGLSDPVTEVPTAISPVSSATRTKPLTSQLTSLPGKVNVSE